MIVGTETSQDRLPEGWRPSDGSSMAQGKFRDLRARKSSGVTLSSSCQLVNLERVLLVNS